VDTFSFGMTAAWVYFWPALASSSITSSVSLEKGSIKSSFFLVVYPDRSLQVALFNGYGL
jgi:hypothetical protein